MQFIIFPYIQIQVAVATCKANPPLDDGTKLTSLKVQFKDKAVKSGKNGMFTPLMRL